MKEKKALFKTINKTSRTSNVSMAGCACVPACTANGGSKEAHERCFDKDGYGF